MKGQISLLTVPIYFLMTAVVSGCGDDSNMSRSWYRDRWANLSDKDTEEETDTGTEEEIDTQDEDSYSDGDGQGDTNEATDPDSGTGEEQNPDTEPEPDTAPDTDTGPPPEPKVLDNSHSGWKKAGCWMTGCHDQTATHNPDLKPSGCVTCHGKNGARVGHRDCTLGCHDGTIQPNHKPNQDFYSFADCQSCHG